MGAERAVVDLIQVLKRIPASVVPADHIGVRVPGRGEDLPAIVVGIGVAKESPIGIGGLVTAQQMSNGQWVTTTGGKTSGSLALEVWTASEEEMNGVTGALFQTIGASKEQLGSAGFIQFGKSALGPMARVPVANGDALRRVIGYSMVHEEIATDTVGPGGIIGQIQVEIGESFRETMELP